MLRPGLATPANFMLEVIFYSFWIFLVEQSEQACHKLQFEDGGCNSLRRPGGDTCRRAGKRCKYQDGQADSGSSNCRDAPALLV